MLWQTLLQNFTLNTKHRMHSCIKPLSSGNILSYCISNVRVRIDKSGYDYESLCIQLLAGTLVITSRGANYLATFNLNIALLNIFKLPAQKKAGVCYC